MMPDMAVHEITKLRQDQQLRPARDGAEGVPISIQYKGLVPELPRDERKRWLLNRFIDDIEGKLSHLGIHLHPATISLSGQTVEGECDVNSLDEVQKTFQPAQYDVKVVKKMQVTQE